MEQPISLTTSSLAEALMRFSCRSQSRLLATAAVFVVSIIGSAHAQSSESYPERCGAKSWEDVPAA